MVLQHGRVPSATETLFCEVLSRGTVLVCVPLLRHSLSLLFTISSPWFYKQVASCLQWEVIIIVHYSLQTRLLSYWTLNCSSRKWDFGAGVLAMVWDAGGGQRVALQQPAGAQGPPGSHSPVLSLQERVSVSPNLTAFHSERKTCLSYQRQPIAFNFEAASKALWWSVVWVPQLNCRCGLEPALYAS